MAIAKGDADIGFIGLGNMGFGMASNVRRKMPQSQTLHIYDVDDAAVRRFADTFSDLGPILIAASAKKVATRSKIVISMVPAGKHALAVHLGRETGVIAAPRDDERLILECSTIEASTAKDIGKTLHEAGRGSYFDTPVSGGVAGAQAGTLAFMIGHPGPQDTSSSSSSSSSSSPLAARILETVSYMGSPNSISFCGALGSGLTTKIVNNYIVLNNALVLAEAMAFGMRHGVDKKILHDTVKASTGDSWVLNHAQPVPGILPNSPSSKGFRAGFAAPLSLKDMALGVQAAGEVGIEASMGVAALKTYQKVADDPRTKDLDFSSLWLHVNDELDSFTQSKTSLAL